VISGPRSRIGIGSFSTTATNTCVVLSNHAFRCWGNGPGGLNGYGNTQTIGDTETPFSAGDVPIGGPVTLVAMGLAHACAVLDTGAVRCWGAGGYGQLGYGISLGSPIGDDETPASMGDVDVGSIERLRGSPASELPRNSKTGGTPAQPGKNSLRNTKLHSVPSSEKP
jgi:hypothetical protein